MALLSEDKRVEIFKALNLGEYNKAGIKALQSKYLAKKSDADGIYGTNTDNLLRHLYNCHKYLNPNNFKPEEFKCECGGKYCSGYPTYMKPAQLANLQAIRSHYSKPMQITSGMRCTGLNRALGGSISNSKHLIGQATDFYMAGVTDTLANRKSFINYSKNLSNTTYIYGNGVNCYKQNGSWRTGSVNAPYMGNAIHYDTSDGNPVSATVAEVKGTSKVATTKYKVIDISYWQRHNKPKIDFNKVKADGVVGVIIRQADGKDKDSYFDENMKGAKAAGLHIGAYVYSRAKTKAEAEAEALNLFNACKPYNCDLPLYIDLEQKGLEKYATTAANAFIAKMKSLGAFSGVYASLNWWNNYLTKVTPPARWVAQYNDKCTYKGGYGMWQYSSEGRVNGISGDVDMNWLYVDYWNKIKPVPTPSPSKKGYSGKFPEYRIKKTNAQVIADTIAWLKYIASNNNFHYGHGRHAHHNGCYFCGTQPSSKKNAGIKMWETTYCCNPFVHAGWTHGGCIPRAMAMCRQGNSWDYSSSGSGTYATCDLFTKLGKPAKSNLKPGDVLCSDEHVALYIGNGQVIQAGHEDDNVKNSSSWNTSISIGTWNGWSRAYRYNSKIDADMSIFHGELSDRVKDLYGFLDWYFDGQVGKADRFYGDKAVAWVKKFQTAQGLKADGIVGPATIQAMKSIKK